MTDRQRGSRMGGIGASEAAALFNLHPRLTRADLRLIKLGLVREDQGYEVGPWGTDDTALLGEVKETALAAVVERCLKVRLVKPKVTYRDDRGILFANVDRQITRAACGSIVVELKDTGIDEGYGQPGTDEVPPFVLIQVAVQMRCAKAIEAIVARERHGWSRGVDLYRICARGDIARMMDAIAVEASRFWTDHIVFRRPLPADDPPPSAAILRRLPMDPAQIAPVDPALVEEWQKWKALAAEVVAAEDLARRRVLDQIGVASAGVYHGGHVAVRVVNPKPVLCPKCAEVVSTRASYRVLSVKQNQEPAQCRVTPEVPLSLPPPTSSTDQTRPAE